MTHRLLESWARTQKRRNDPANPRASQVRVSPRAGGNIRADHSGPPLRHETGLPHAWRREVPGSGGVARPDCRWPRSRALESSRGREGDNEASLLMGAFAISSRSVSGLGLPDLRVP